MPAYLVAWLLAWLLCCLLGCLLTCLPTWLLAYLVAWLVGCLLACLLTYVVDSWWCQLDVNGSRPYGPRWAEQVQRCVHAPNERSLFREAVSGSSTTGFPQQFGLRPRPRPRSASPAPIPLPVPASTYTIALPSSSARSVVPISYGCTRSAAATSLTTRRGRSIGLASTVSAIFTRTPVCGGGCEGR